MINIMNESRVHPILEMANLSKTKLNIPVNCWISVETQNKHRPRIKVQQDTVNKINYNNFCSVSISDDPQVLAGTWKLDKKDTNKILSFIRINHKKLLLMWEHELEASDLINELET